MNPPYDETLDDGLGEEAEVVDGEVVENFGGLRGTEARSPASASPPRAPVTPAAPAARGSALGSVRSMPVAAQAAAVAATSFAAGAVATAVVRRVARKQTVRSRRSKTHGLPVVGTRSFLVDVHLLAPRRD